MQQEVVVFVGPRVPLRKGAAFVCGKYCDKHLGVEVRLAMAELHSHWLKWTYEKERNLLCTGERNTKQKEGEEGGELRVSPGLDSKITPKQGGVQTLTPEII